MAEVTIDLSVAEIGLSKIRMLSGRFVDHLFDIAQNAIKEVYMKKLEAEVSLTDHTLKALRIMGHPYAKRHGSIQIHSENPFQVHVQSGGLKSSFQMKADKTKEQIRTEVLGSATATSAIFARATGEIKMSWSITSNAEVAAYVSRGTDRMLPRDFAGEAIKLSAGDIRSHLVSNVHLGGL